MEDNRIDIAIDQLQNSILVLDVTVALLAAQIAELRAQQEASQAQYTLDLNTKGQVIGFTVKGAE